MELKLTPNAKLKPTMPPGPVEGYVGSDILLDLVGIPAEIGNCTITAVRVSAHFADESATTVACGREANGTWSCTIPGNATSGRVANGVQILVDGTTTSGATVTGSVLAICDLAIYTRDMTINAGGTVWYLHYFDVAPATPKKGDVAPVDGVLKLYNGTAWVAFAAGITLDDAVTRTSANGVKSSGIWAAIWGALTALPSGFTSLYDWCVEQLSGKASTADATLNLRGPNKDGFSAWTIKRAGVDVTEQARQPEYLGEITEGLYLWRVYVIEGDDGQTQVSTTDGRDAVFLEWSSSGGMYTATRTALPGYQLGSQSDKPLASEAEAEALRAAVAGKQDALTSAQLANIEAVPAKANRAANPTAGNLAALDANGNPTNSTIPAATVATKGNIPYDLVAKTIANGAVTLDDRAINAVAVSSSLASLTINFPAATSGKVRDFGLRLTVASGITTAPELALPQGVTCENADGEAPEIGADGAATILYFTETASGVFLVKGEVVTAIP